jgi:hypothetical protein
MSRSSGVAASDASWAGAASPVLCDQPLVQSGEHVGRHRVKETVEADAVEEAPPLLTPRADESIHRQRRASLFNLMFSRSSLRVVDSNSSSRASLRAISPGLSGPTS